MSKNQEQTNYNNILSKLNALSYEEIDAVENEIKEIKKKKEKNQIPTNIFNAELSAFESIVKYLKENKELKHKEIAKLLKRNASTIGVVYINATKKQPKKLVIKEIETTIPTNVFSNNQTILETVIINLKKQGLTTKQISKILKRHYRTVWTIQKRLEQKIKGVEQK